MKRQVLWLAATAAFSASMWVEVAHAGEPILMNSSSQVGADGIRRMEKGDPFEGVNRRSYALSDVIDRVLFRPLAMTYRRILPRPVRNAAHNVVANLNEPSTVVNDVLQGKAKNAASASLRFAVNTTIGVAGIFDVAYAAGLARHDNDFGLTLGKWRVGAGPYLYVPVAGPSSFRDLTGTGVDFLLDPLGWIDFRNSEILLNSQTLVGALDTRVKLDRGLHDLKLMAIDPYASLRSVYLQSRESKIHDGVVNVEQLPDFPDDPPSATPAPSTEDSNPSLQTTDAVAMPPASRVLAPN